jgi:YVTN family beta-propeller protein
VSALLLATGMLVATSLPAAAETVVATVGVGRSPFALGVNPSTNRIYVANENESTVSVIDGSTNAVVATGGRGRWSCRRGGQSHHQPHLRRQ